MSMLTHMCSQKSLKEDQMAACCHQTDCPWVVSDVVIGGGDRVSHIRWSYRNSQVKLGVIPQPCYGKCFNTQAHVVHSVLYVVFNSAE